MDTAVPFSQVAAVHVDAPDAETDVAAAVADPSDAALVERAMDHDLAWYAVQEIDELLP